MEIRESIRAVLVDGDGRVLLSKVQPLDPGKSGVGIWVTLGGRLWPGEVPQACLIRELMEELGHDNFVIGPKIWYGEQIVNWGRQKKRLVEHFYLVKACHQDASFVGVNDQERRTTFSLRWWSARELRMSPERFVPVRLPLLVQPILEGNFPTDGYETVRLEP